MKKIFFIFYILACLSGFTFAEENKYQFSIFGGINNVFKYGSEDDYVMGENDFPLTPAHIPPGFGMSFAYFFKSNIGIELDGKYTLSSKVTLQDPSDKDTIEINTSKHYSITINFIYQFLRGNFRSYFAVGGGIDKVLAKDETYTSAYGIEIELLAPEKTIDPVAHAGGGIHFFLMPNAGLRLDVRYVIIFDEPNNVNSFTVMAGAFFGF